MKFAAIRIVFFVLLVVNCACLLGQAAVQNCHINQTALGLHVMSGEGDIDLQILGPNLVRIDVHPHGKSIRLTFERPSGSFHSALRSYLVRVHGTRPAKRVAMNGKPLSKGSANSLESSASGTLWTTDVDKFGYVTTIRIPSQQASSVELR